MRRTEIFGTIGASCSDEQTLLEMMGAGMTGVRLNLSHASLAESGDILQAFQRAKKRFGDPGMDLLIDLKGPELRIGVCESRMLAEGQETDIPIGASLIPIFENGMRVLIDDGKICGQVTAVKSSEGCLSMRVLRGGELSSKKSIKIEGYETNLPALTEEDEQSIRQAKAAGVTAVMQPFVRSADDIRTVLDALGKADAESLRLFAKIENRTGIRELSGILSALKDAGRSGDRIVIARGDLGNDMPLWELPAAQKEIEAACHAADIPYVVVTQMMTSMIEHEIPTRAEVSDAFHALYHGAAAVMVTNETAVGRYPVEVIRYLKRISESAARISLRGKME